MDHLHTYDLGADGNVDTIYLNGGTSDDNAAVTANDYVVGSAVNRNINQNDLEWEIPISALPAGSFTMYGSTVNSTDGDTYTISGPITVPEPASTSLLVLGGVGVLSRRRRRA